MNKYSVSLCLSVEADNETDAIAKFAEMVEEGNFDGDSIEAEQEQE